MEMKKSVALLIFSIPLATAISPADEKPTDSSIWVVIDDATFSIDEIGEMAKITIEANGRASPGVHHCGIVFLTVYKNGSTNYNGNFIIGPLNISGSEPLIFEPLGNSWEKWRFYHVAYVEKDKLGLNESQMGNISSFEIWVRCYGNEEGTKWNQSHITVTEEVKKEVEEFYSEKGGSNPYLYFLAAIAIIFIASVAIYIKRR